MERMASCIQEAQTEGHKMSFPQKHSNPYYV